MRSEQSYVTNTAVLTTRLTDDAGGVVEITDCAPCFFQYGRLFQPMTIVRSLRRVAGKPRVVVRLRPSDAYGRARPQRTVGSRHVRYVGSDLALRLTTDAPITAILEERPFLLEDTVTLLLGADESVTSDVHQVGRRFIEETLAYWRAWVRRLAIPFEWQDAVIRAAITLQLNTFDDTGAIIAAMTTSIPEAPDSGRNWDYRYCWLRDSYFVVNALNRLGATETMENYLRYIAGIVAGVGRRAAAAGLPDQRRRRADRAGRRSARRLSRHGSGAHRQRRVPADAARRLRRGDPCRDALVLRPAPDSRRRRRAVRAPGAAGASRHRRPRPAGRGHLGIPQHRARAHVLERHVLGGVRPAGAHRARGSDCRNARRRGRRRPRAFTPSSQRIAGTTQRGSYVGAVGGTEIDASLLLLAELNFTTPDDPRFIATVEVIERELKRGDYVFRYLEKDDFGTPRNAFVVCTFWLIDALAAIGRHGRGARAVRETAGAGAIATACLPSTSIRAPARRGATSCRPTAWSA